MNPNPSQPSSHSCCDVIVIGGGHAGIEAALAAARMGVRTCMITVAQDKIGEMSCNPAIGGTAKGHLVKEIDALGGEMGLATDASGIQFRFLNRSKGPAIWSSRAQADMGLYRRYMQEVVATTKNLRVLEGMVGEVLFETQTQNRVTGVKLENGAVVSAAAVIVTTGTFLNGTIHIGFERIKAGRRNEPASEKLAETFKSLGLPMGRMKTGTTPRIDKRTIDTSGLEVQGSDPDFVPFSARTKKISQPLVNCYVTYTNNQTHEVIRNHMHESPLYSGVIKGIGPRYCPSIEDKVVKFPQRVGHQVFLEPEGYTSELVYPAGISTSLPLEIQYKFLHTMKGLQNAVIVKPGYAIEYDFLQPTALHPTLALKDATGLYFAGQINGTTGYEEAAAQGLIAGINAALFCKGEAPFVLSRHEAYIGVLIDDLTTLGTEEPYRMFTSRAENRLKLREDNADVRLAHHGHRLGLVQESMIEAIEAREKEIFAERARLEKIFINPGDERAKQLETQDLAPVLTGTSVLAYLKRPEVDARSAQSSGLISPDLNLSALRRLEIEIKYEGYIKREESAARKLEKLDHIWIPPNFDFGAVSGLSREVVEKLRRLRPSTLGQASRISGITPAAITLLCAVFEKSKILPDYAKHGKGAEQVFT